MPEYKLYQEPLRPKYHFTSRYWDDYRLNPGWHQEGWINDVNGLMKLNNEYHLFAQRWWSCWLHGISTDLVHWQELPPAFEKDDEFGGTQSGGGVVDYDNTSGLATGETPVMVAFWTALDNERQCISYSNDQGRTWTKYEKNPILTFGLRDPQVFRHHPTNQWIMVLYGPKEGDRDFYTLFRSSNLLDWEKLHSVPDMYECPDMFELPIDGDVSNCKWVMVNGNAEYYVGDFDGTTFSPDGEKITGDYGRNYYATMTWGDMPDEPGRRIQIAWMRVYDMDLDMPFSQQLSFPCDLSLRKTSRGIRLCRTPVREISELYSGEIPCRGWAVEGTHSFDAIDDESFDAEIQINIRESTCKEFKLFINGYPVTFNMSERTLNVLGRISRWDFAEDILKLRVLADRISMELFLNDGEWTSSSIVLPVEAASRLSIHVACGTLIVESVETHTIKSMWEGAVLYEEAE